MGQDLYAHFLEILFNDICVALDIVIADEIYCILACYLGFKCADLFIDPVNVENMVTFRLADPRESRALNDKDINIGHLGHHVFSHGFRIVADQGRSTCSVDKHPLDPGHCLESFNYALLKLFLGAEYNMLFPHICRPDIFKLEVVVIAGISLGMPGIVSAADRSMDHLDAVLDDPADDKLGSAVAAPPFR